jgi:hypothetical protein
MVIATPAHAAGIDPGTAAQQFFDLANNARAAAGVPALQWRDDVAGMAVGHSAEMAAAGSIWHGSFVSQGNLSALNASLLAENVGMGSDVQTVQDAFMNSEHHRENILDPGVNRVCFGVFVAGDGTVYITEDFLHAKGVAAARPAAAPASTSKPTASKPASSAAAPKPVTTRVAAAATAHAATASAPPATAPPTTAVPAPAPVGVVNAMPFPAAPATSASSPAGGTLSDALSGGTPAMWAAMFGVLLLVFALSGPAVVRRRRLA